MSEKPAIFRKKPVEIEAIRWDGTAAGATPIIEWILAAGATATYVCSNPDRCAENDGDTPHAIVIRTLEGDMRAELGDWIIKGVENEFYPCKPGIFAATYRPEGQFWKDLRENLKDPEFRETYIAFSREIAAQQPAAPSPDVPDRCAHCGHPLAGVATIEGAPVCHPSKSSALLDCYRLVTVYGEELGSRRASRPDDVPDELVDLYRRSYKDTPSVAAHRRALAAVLTAHERQARERVAAEIEETIDADVPGQYEAGLERAARIARGES